LVLRYLQGMAWKYDETHKTINEHFEWCNESIPFSISPIEDLLKQGIFYIHKRDRGFRPIVIINVERMLASKVT